LKHPTASEVSDYIDQIAPPDSGVEGDIIGVIRSGDDDHDVKKIAISWALPVDTLLSVRDWGADVIILHEMPIYPNVESPWHDYFPPSEILPDMYRAHIVEKWNGPLTIIRAHSNWDARVPEGVPETFGRFIGLGEPADGGRFTRVYDIPQTTLNDMRDRLAPMMADWTGTTACPPRLFGDPAQSFTRVGLMIGGFGGNQWNMIEELYRLGAQAVIVGDLVEIIAMHALELGIGVIETSHSFTEQPAMETLAAMLSNRFKTVDIKVFKSGAHPLKTVSVKEMSDAIEAMRKKKEDEIKAAAGDAGGSTEGGNGLENANADAELQEAMRDFKEKQPQLWQRVELVMRMQKMQKDAGGEFKRDQMILHLFGPVGREFMIRAIRAIDLASASVVLSVYDYGEIVEGTVFVPLEFVGWFGAPTDIEQRELGFAFRNASIDPDTLSAASSSILRRPARKTRRFPKAADSDDQPL